MGGHAYQGSHMSHSNAFNHSTFSNLNTSVLAQQKRSSSTHHYKGSASKRPSSSHHGTGSTKKQSTSQSRHGYQSQVVANQAYGSSTANHIIENYGKDTSKKGDAAASRTN